MPPAEGRGDYSLPRWYFDSSSRTCRQFQYRGTQGNANNFQSQADCEQTCSGKIALITTRHHPPTSAFQWSRILALNRCHLQYRRTAPPSIRHARLVNGAISAKIEKRLCAALAVSPRVHYEVHSAAKKYIVSVFFLAIDNPCILPLNPGFGTSQLPRYYFNPDSNQCVQFTYRGTQGNQNNFMTMQDCEQQCNRKSDASSKKTLSQLPFLAFPNPCPNGEPLMSPGPTPFNRPQTCNALSTSSSCPSSYWCHVGATLDTTVCCPGASDPCVQPVATGVGNASLPRWYYDPGSRQCVQFSYSGTKGNQNNFPSMEACRVACRGTVLMLPQKQP